MSLASAGAGRTLLDGSVGRGGGNAVQAALANIRVPNENRDFWTATIDGKATTPLAQAIEAFQSHAHQAATGLVKPGDATACALEAQLPAALNGRTGTVTAFG